MSLLQANPLLYLNMGGEMLYVLRQRLKAQKIAIDKSVQVLDEVSGALVNPAIISKIFQQNTMSIDLSMIRTSLEKAVLSSIMRLDDTSMGKLFDLMIMMVKYQLSAATGPRELLLITLNHIDVMRDLLIDPRSQEFLVIVHRMLIQLYGNYTYDQMWQTREICLSHLENYNVRVSILLRMDLQNENGTFKFPLGRTYDERYEEQRNKDDLSGLRLLGNSCQGCNVGSLELIGNRVTSLGCNMYVSQSTRRNSVASKREARALIFKGEPGSRAELGMLAMQLGSNEDDYDDSTNLDDAPSSNGDRSAKKQTRPFTLRLFNDNFDYVKSVQSNETNSRRSSTTVVQDPVDDEKSHDTVSNDLHKAKLHDICANFLADEEETRASFSRKMELLDLMDQLE